MGNQHTLQSDLQATNGQQQLEETPSQFKGHAPSYSNLHPLEGQAPLQSNLHSSRGEPPFEDEPLIKEEQNQIPLRDPREQVFKKELEIIGELDSFPLISFL